MGAPNVRLYSSTTFYWTLSPPPLPPLSKTDHEFIEQALIFSGGTSFSCDILSFHGKKVQILLT